MSDYETPPSDTSGAEAPSAPKRSRAAWICLFAVTLVYAGHLIYAAGVLPRRVASHFNIRGEADYFMMRDAHLVLMGLLGIMFPAMLVGIASAIKHLPRSTVNIPNRDYWLADNHIHEARRRLINHMVWYAAGIQLFFIGVHQLMIDANQREPQHLENGPMGALLAAVLMMTGLWLVSLYRRFRVPD